MQSKGYAVPPDLDALEPGQTPAPLVLPTPSAVGVISVGGGQVAGGACGDAAAAPTAPTPTKLPDAPTAPSAHSPAPVDPCSLLRTDGNVLVGCVTYPKILKATIEQNSAVPCADNTLSVCVRTDSTFENVTKSLDIETVQGQGSVIQDVILYKNINVKGLKGTCAYTTPTGQIAITGLGEHAGLFTVGNWSKDTGELNIAVRGRVENDMDVCFNFTLQNPSCSVVCGRRRHQGEHHIGLHRRYKRRSQVLEQGDLCARWRSGHQRQRRRQRSALGVL